MVIALILWVLANALGSIGGSREKATRGCRAAGGRRRRAERELRTRLRDPVSLASSCGSGLVVIVILVLMIWKPGA